MIDCLALYEFDHDHHDHHYSDIL